MTKVSVIICCYNSTARLPETLRHLALQEVPMGFSWEVIVVDNNSTDDTAEVAKYLWGNYGASVPLRVVKEPQPGLSHARKKGVMESNGKILIFCDDDNWLSPNYIITAHEYMIENEEIAILGALGIPRYSGIPEKYVIDSAEGMLAVGKENRRDGIVPSVYGAGMVIRMSAAKSVFQDEIQFILVDRKGKNLSSGGDTELCKMVNLSDIGKVGFLSNLTFNHNIESSRLSFSYLKNLNYNIGKSTAALKSYDWILLTKNRLYSKVLKCLLKSFYNIGYIIVSPNSNLKIKIIKVQYHLGKISFLVKNLVRINYLVEKAHRNICKLNCRFAQSTNFN